MFPNFISKSFYDKTYGRFNSKGRSMLTQINIKRVNGTVIFQTVSINNTDNVFFTNQDPASESHEVDPLARLLRR